MTEEPRDGTEERSEPDEIVEGEVVDDASDPGITLPDDPEEAVTVLVSEVMDARARGEAHLDDLRRLAAEFENFRKRAERDRVQLVTRATQGLVERILPVLDTFDAALATKATTDPEKRMLEGMASTREQLLTVLAQEGVTVIPTVGLAFDPEVHEAVSGGGTGHLVVTQEMRRGYKMGDRVVRPALVAVAAEAVAGESPEEG